MPDDLVSIGTFASAARVTVRTLRHYHDLGLVAPAAVDPSSGYRSYRWSQLTDVLTITTLRDLGVPLASVRRHLVDGVALADVLAGERARLEAEAARAARRVAVLDALAEAVSLPVPEVEVVTLDRVGTWTLAGDATGATLTADATELIGRLLTAASTAGVSTEPPVVGEYPVVLDGACHIRVHLPVGAPDAGGAAGATAVAGDDPADRAALTSASVFGGRYARAVHVGAYETLPLAYHGLLRWMHEGGHPTNGPVLERYLDDPATADPSTLRTEVLHALPAGADRG